MAIIGSSDRWSSCRKSLSESVRVVDNGTGSDFKEFDDAGLSKCVNDLHDRILRLQKCPDAWSIIIILSTRN